MRRTNFHKVHAMSLFQLKVLNAILSVVLAYYSFSMAGLIKHIQHLIITPDGILFNRRKTNRFVFPERRLARIIRIKIAVWLLDFNDDGSFT